MADGFFGKFRQLIGVDEVEEETTDQVSSQPQAAARPQQSVPERKPQYADRNNAFVQPRMENRENKVVNMQNNAKKPFKMVIIEPKSFDECPKLVDNLKNRRPVIINLENLDNERARKIFDFLSGATYALDGNVQKVANNIFVFAPESVDLQAGIEVDGKGAFSLGSDSPWKK